MCEFFIEHRAVDLSLDSEDEPTLSNRETVCEAIENSLFRHPCVMLRINLNRLRSGRGWKGIASIVRRRADVGNIRSHVDEASHFRVISGFADYGASPRVAHEDDRPIL